MGYIYYDEYWLIMTSVQPFNDKQMVSFFVVMFNRNRILLGHELPPLNIWIVRHWVG